MVKQLTTVITLIWNAGIGPSSHFFSSFMSFCASSGQFLATASNWNDPILYTRCIVFSYIEEEEEEEEEKM